MITLTTRAVKEVNKIAKEANLIPPIYLHIGIDADDFSCSLNIIEKEDVYETDQIFKQGRIVVVVDEDALSCLDGAVIDFDGQSFQT